MLELWAHSPLEGLPPFARDNLHITEMQDYSVTQVSGFGRSFEKSLAAVIGKLPNRIGEAIEAGSRTVMRVAPQQFWIIGAAEEDFAKSLPEECLVTPLSSSRFRIRVEGEASRHLLARCAAIDFHSSVFKPGQFAMTGIHHTPVLIHCVGEEDFHLYALRTFARDVWEWLVDASAGLD